MLVKEAEQLKVLIDAIEGMDTSSLTEKELEMVKWFKPLSRMLIEMIPTVNDPYQSVLIMKKYFVLREDVEEDIRENNRLQRERDYYEETLEDIFMLIDEKLSKESDFEEQKTEQIISEPLNFHDMLKQAGILR